MIDTKECDRNIRTYGDVIRHMTNDELALFLDQMFGNIEMGLLAIMRAKMYPHRVGGDDRMETDEVQSYKSFMEGRISHEDANFAEVWGVENWQDLMQWVWPDKKNFGMDVVY